MAKLIRQSDNLQKEGFIEFVEFDKNGRGKNIHMKPKVGYACIVDRGITYKWLTSVIIKIVSDIEFYTENSHYKIEN